DPSEVDWNAGRLGPDPVADYEKAASAYLDAFVPDTVLSRDLRIGVFGVVPGSVGVVMHFVGTVAPGWDVARTIGPPHELDEELPATALDFMRKFPSDRPSAAFDVVLDVPDEASSLDRFLAFVGRSPLWTRPW